MSLYILDSDHLSLYQRGHQSLRTYLSQIPSEQIAITVISIEELVRGRLAQIHKAIKSEERISAYRWLSQTFVFLCDFAILEFDAQAEAQFQKLRGQKIKIGSQDLKIGAITLCRGAILVTRNQRDFAQIPGLTINDWSTTQIN